VRETGTLAGALQKLGASLEGREEAERLFLQPATISDYRLHWGAPDEARVVDLLVGRHAFTEDRVRSALAKFAGLREARKQRSLDAFS
jgi:flap endonuclease-1